MKTRKIQKIVKKGFTNQPKCAIIYESSGTTAKQSTGVSPSGKAADSDSVISRVQILPPQPNFLIAKRVASYASQLASFFKRMYQSQLSVCLQDLQRRIISSPPLRVRFAVIATSVMPTDSRHALDRSKPFLVTCLKRKGQEVDSE